MSFIYNTDRTIDGENTLTADIINCNLDFEVEGEKGSADQYLHKNTATNALEWSYSTNQISAGTHLSLSDGVMNCNLVQDSTLDSENLKKNYITIDGEKIKLNLSFGDGITLVSAAPADNPTHDLRANIISDTTLSLKGISVASGYEVGLDIENLPVTTTLDTTGNHLSKLIVQKYDTVAQLWKNSSINADKLSDAIYVPYIGGTGIGIDNNEISNTGVLSVIPKSGGTGFLTATLSGTTVSIDTSFTLGTDLKLVNNQLFTAYEFSGHYIGTTALANGILQVDSLFRAGTNVTFTEDTGNATWDINVDLSGLTYSEPAYEVTTAAGYIRPATDGQGTVGDHNHKFNKIFVNTSSGFEVQGDLTFDSSLRTIGTLGGNEPMIFAGAITCSSLILPGNLTVGGINTFIMKGNLLIVDAETNTHSIGASNAMLANLYSTNIHSTTVTSTNISGFNLEGHITVTSDQTQDVGTATHRLGSLYSKNITGETLVTSNATFNNAHGIKCFDFDASTGKTTFYQKTGVGTATRAIFTIDPATPTVDSNGNLTSSPMNFNTNAIPHFNQHNHLYPGDLLIYSGSANHDYLTIKK